MRRSLVTLTAVASRLVLGTALVAAGALAVRPADAGTVSNGVRTVAVGGTVRPDGRGGWRTESNATHSTRGVLRPRCQSNGLLRVDVRPRTRAAGWWTATVDGTLAVQDITVGFSSVQGGRLLLVFTRHGERISCADITAPGSNVWLAGVQVLR